MSNVLQFPGKSESLPVLTLRYPPSGGLVIGVVAAPPEGIELSRQEVELLHARLGAFLAK